MTSSTTRRQAARIVTIVTVLIGGMLGATVPAQAVECPIATLCLYNTAGGLPWTYGAYSGTGCRTLPSSIDNRTSYIINNSGRQFQVYVSPGCLSDHAPVYAYSRGAMNSTFDNKISSFR
jgi:hypothetical protein